MLTFQTRQAPIGQGQKALVVSPMGTIEKRTVHQFEKQMMDYYSIGYRYVILDCAAIHSINSTGLQVLLKLVETFQNAGGILLLIQVLPQISKFFDMLGFSPIFTTFTKDEEAVQYLLEQISQGEPVEGEGAFEKPARPLPPPQPPPRPLPQSPHQQSAPQGATTRSYNNPKSPDKSEPKTFSPAKAEVLYYRKMYTRDLSPLKVKIIPERRTGESSSVQIFPYFPGSLVVPDSRIMSLSEEGEATFWITPLVNKKFQASLEFWLEDKVSRVTLKTRSGNQRWSKLFVLFAIAIPILCRLSSVQEIVEGLFFLLPVAIPQDAEGFIVGAALLIIGFLLYLFKRPHRGKSLVHPLEFP